MLIRIHVLIIIISMQDDIQKEIADQIALGLELTKLIPKDGIDGRDGRDGKDGEDGRDGLHGEPGKDGKNGSPDSPIVIAEKLNTLEGTVNSSVIKGLPKIEDFVKSIKKGGINQLEIGDIKGAKI